MHCSNSSSNTAAFADTSAAANTAAAHTAAADTAAADAIAAAGTTGDCSCCQ
jgi:hypothetical protein